MIMPRKRRPQPAKPDLAYFNAPVGPALDVNLDHAAYRLWHIIIIYAKASPDGICWLENVELAALMRGKGGNVCSREYVRRLVGELSAIGLVSESLTDAGRRGLIPARADVWAKNAAVGPRFLEPEDALFAPPGPADNGGRATGGVCTPHVVNSSCANPSTLVDGTPHDDEDSINLHHQQLDKISSTTVDNTTSTPLDEIDMVRLQALWRHYFGGIAPVDEAFMGELVARPKFRQEAQARSRSPTELMRELITTAAENHAKHPTPYIKKMWLGIVGGESNQSASSPNGNGSRPETPAAVLWADLPEPMPVETTIWTETQAALRRQMTRATYDAIVAQTELLARGENGVCVIGVKSEMAKEWLENRLCDIVKRTLSNVLGAQVEVKFKLVEGSS